MNYVWYLVVFKFQFGDRLALATLSGMEIITIMDLIEYPYQYRYTIE